MVCHQEWSANPLFERKDNKKEALLDLDGRVANLNKRYAAVKDAGVRIQAMVVVRRPWGEQGGGLRGRGVLEAACSLWRGERGGLAEHFIQMTSVLMATKSISFHPRWPDPSLIPVMFCPLFQGDQSTTNPCTTVRMDW